MAGRRILWTDEREVNRENVVRVLEAALPAFFENQMNCDYLIRFEQGEQPLQREKTYRKDIDIVCIDNVANEIATFKTSFVWGSEMSLVQRGRKEMGENSNISQEAVALLNECYSAEMARSKTQELAYYIEVTGIGYTLIDINTEYEDGDSYFRYVVFDPMHAFVIRSTTYTDHRVVVAVTFREDASGNRYFTCFTPQSRFEIVGGRIQNGPVEDYEYWHTGRSGEANPLGIIPLVEWFRSYDRMGCFERQVDDMNTLNIEESDFANLVDQNVQSIWHANDVEFSKDENGKEITPSSNDWVFTQTTRDGKTPFITPLAVNSDYAGIMTNIASKRALILQKCNVPQRNDNSGGSTGVAMSDATGWSQADVEATKQEGIIEGCKMQEIRVALAAIRRSPFVPSDSPLLQLKPFDVKPNIKRQKNYELVSKVNAFAVMVGHGIHGLHAIRAISLFEDPQQVYEDSEELINKYQASIFERTQTSSSAVPEKAGSDEVDQIENSPTLDGMGSGPVEVKSEA